MRTWLGGMAAGIWYFPARQGARPKIDTVANRPVHVVMQGVIGQRLGFGGVIMTDGLLMGALPAGHEAEAAERAFTAGPDILLRGGNQSVPAAMIEEAIGRVTAAVRIGRVFLSRLDEAVGRIQALEQRYPPDRDLTSVQGVSAGKSASGGTDGNTTIQRGFSTLFLNGSVNTESTGGQRRPLWRSSCSPMPLMMGRMGSRSGSWGETSCTGRLHGCCRAYLAQDMRYVYADYVDEEARLRSQLYAQRAIGAPLCEGQECASTASIGWRGRTSCSHWRLSGSASLERSSSWDAPAAEAG